MPILSTAKEAPADDAHTVEALLEKLKLRQYLEKLTEEGYETISDLKDARLEDLMGDCNIKKPHAKRILKHFGEQQHAMS